MDILAGLIIIFICVGVWFFKPSTQKDAQKNPAEIKDRTKGGFFTTLESENIMFIVSQKSHIRTVIDIKGHMLNDEGDIIPIKDSNGQTDFRQPPDPWLKTTFGVWWVGIPMFRQKYFFPIVKERENPNVKPDTDPKDWVKRDAPIMISELRWKFPRPVLVPEVEFLGNIRGNILVLANFQVVNPYRAVFTQNAKFFEIINAYIQTAVIEYCKSRTFNVFRMANKQIGNKSISGTDPDGFSQFIIENVNEGLTKETGICITGATVTRFDSSDAATQRALEANELAELQGQAAITKEKREAEAALVRATGQANALEKLAAASIADVKTLTDALIEKGVPASIAAQQAVALARISRLEKTKLITFVDGNNGNNPLALPTDDRSGR